MTVNTVPVACLASGLGFLGAAVLGAILGHLTVIGVYVGKIVVDSLAGRDTGDADD